MRSFHAFSMWIRVEACGLLLLTGCVAPRQQLPFRRTAGEPAVRLEEARPTVRVALLAGVRAVTVRAPEAFGLSGCSLEGTSAVEEEGVPHREAVLTASRIQGGIARLVPLGKSGKIQVNGRPYRGTLEVHADPAGRLTVVNEVDLEDYVAGVVASEVPSSWPPAALQAQAVAARTYALYQREAARAEGRPFDLESHVRHQVYGGSGAREDSVRRAVWETRGEILTWDRKPAFASFHSNCGGRTASADSVWSREIPYLKSVPCRFDHRGPHYTWKARISDGDLTRLLRKAGFETGPVEEMDVPARDADGRALRVEWTDGEGRRHRMRGSEFRMAVGPDLVRSTRFTVRREGGAFRFEGRGFGHGVGLCQEGAKGYAEEGKDAHWILRHYYPGVRLEKISAARSEF